MRTMTVTQQFRDATGIPGNRSKLNQAHRDFLMSE